ncbi:nucleotide-binding protein [Janthinobacterium sp. CG3]|uniref:PRK13886 family protein n=1 Tax=Janthinobacterium sp. CG3 TaxID=1075768 RepID=UPI00034B3A5B|nr:conjugal transfer protein TraL [Janthinobacterium sp. CG3]
MAKIHFILQGKGGVGKSVVAAFLAQFISDKGAPPTNIDTDPVNSTFCGYKSLNVKRLEIMENEEINPRSFDTLVEMIAAANGDVIIDNGASSFVPLSHFLISNQVPALLAEMGHELVVHTVVTGGQALLDTISGFNQLVSQFPAEALFVVWLNPFWGPIEHEGKGFEQMKAYTTNKARVSAIIQLPSLKKETYGRDLGEMLQDRLTFDQAIAQESLTIMTRQRLKIIKGQVYTQMDNATVL